MNEGKKDKWRSPKNVNGIMFFGHNNITRTNPFGDYVLRSPKVKQENRRKFFKWWLEPHPFKRQQTKTLWVFTSNSQTIKDQIQRGNDEI
jgi:hypothetical protein